VFTVYPVTGNRVDYWKRVLNLGVIIGLLPIRDWFAVRMTQLGSLTASRLRKNKSAVDAIPFCFTHTW
jgi:hypothetical protein